MRHYYAYEIPPNGTKVDAIPYMFDDKSARDKFISRNRHMRGRLSRRKFDKMSNSFMRYVHNDAVWRKYVDVESQ